MKTNEERLSVYDRVNNAETLKDIQDCIMSLADKDGLIQGRTQKFDATKMAEDAARYLDGQEFPNVITREFGLRQQLMHIKYFMS